MKAVPEITNHAAATVEQLTARNAYALYMFRTIRHRQTRNEWFSDAYACQEELKRRAPAHPEGNSNE